MYYNNRRLVLSVFWAVLGAVLLVLSLTEVLDDSIYAGMGGALIAVGILQIIRNFRYRSNPDYREKINTEADDERNRFLRMKSWSWTGYITVLAEAIGLITALILKQDTVRNVLSYSICLIVGLYWITYMVLSRKY